MDINREMGAAGSSFPSFEISRKVRAAFFLQALICSIAGAALLTPNGNPTGPNPAVEAPPNQGKSTLDLDATYVVAGNCPWLLPALSAEHFGASNGWTINLIPLQGNLILGTYAPWVDLRPGFTQGVFAVPPTPLPGKGGLVFGLSYVPASPLPTTTNEGGNNPDPSITSWIQVIHTNDPNAFGVSNGVYGGGGYTNYIDNGYAYPPTTTGPPPQNPFYNNWMDFDSFVPNRGNGGNANGTDFVDGPSRYLTSGADWQAQVFLATWYPNNPNDSLMGGTIDIYDGVWYGFNVSIPEPGTLSLFGGFALLVLRRRRPIAHSAPLQTSDKLNTFCVGHPPASPKERSCVDLPLCQRPDAQCLCQHP
jgi:hypothetical protein